MDIRKNTFYMFSLVLICHHHLATASMMATSTERIEQQINGTLNICRDILGYLWKNGSNKQLHENNAMFNVCVPRKEAFREFVEFSNDGELTGGFSIAIFCLALQELPVNIQPVFKSIKNESYTEVVRKLEGKDCDAVAGDITITSTRTKYADFTRPYISSDIYKLVQAVPKQNQNVSIFVKPFTIELWMAILFTSIFVGFAIGFMEDQVNNPYFDIAPYFRRVLRIFYFHIWKLFTQEGEIRCRGSKVVLVIWLLTIFIVAQIYMASLSTWLTTKQLQPKQTKEPQVVGYQHGSFIVDFVNDYVQNSNITIKAIPVSTMVDYKNLLDNGTVEAIFDERIYIDIFLAKYGDMYMKVGPIADGPGLGFAFRRESYVLQNFSNAVVKVIESQNITAMKKKYLGIQTPLTTQLDDISSPQSFGLEGLGYLVLFLLGLNILIFLIVAVCRVVSDYYDDGQQNDRQPIDGQRNGGIEMNTISANSTTN